MSLSREVTELKERESYTSPPHLVNPLGLHLLSRPGRGRGVFTSRDLPAGVTIEESPVLVLKRDEWELGKMNDTILGEYGFCWPDGGMGIALGLGA
jgi:tRNA-specific adenosine deaminase 3